MHAVCNPYPKFKNSHVRSCFIPNPDKHGWVLNFHIELQNVIKFALLKSPRLAAKCTINKSAGVLFDWLSRKKVSSDVLGDSATKLINKNQP